jgi:hypothetical protein
VRRGSSSARPSENVPGDQNDDGYGAGEEQGKPTVHGASLHPHRPSGTNNQVKKTIEKRPGRNPERHFAPDDRQAGQREGQRQ